ncbi:MAG: prepilin-type N-terminal cleavage/methylation domain-containing protein [Deltaproteobacteria bacterium]|nr:prepilin-type N-terminal cleavage/methylation domain-containing protein [Deltaproteobacteria bacterium]
MTPARGQAIDRRGFTLLEVLLASAILGFSLLAVLGFHAQAARSNLHARKITACSSLAQTRMEQLLSLAWTETNQPVDLQDLGGDPTSPSSPWSLLPHPSTGAWPVNAVGNTDPTYGASEYWVFWAVESMDDPPTWIRIRVRCAWYDARFDTWRGTTISTFRFRDT